MKKNSFKLDPQLSIVIGIFIIFGGIVFTINKQAETTWPDFVLILNNAFMNIFIFGILLTWLEKKRRRRHLNQSYLEQLEDFRFWRSEEGVWRKVGILRRLRNLEANLPDLSGIELENAMLESWDLTDLKMNHANLSNAFLWQSDVSKTNFERAVMERIYLENTVLNDTNFTKTYMAMADCREATGKNALFICANLESSLFGNAQLHGCSFEAANLEKVSFESANLANCLFYNAHLAGCNFSGASIDGSDFRNTDLSGVLNLTAGQLEHAIIDDSTKLPLELQTERDNLLERMKTKQTNPVSSHFEGGTPHYRTKPNIKDHRRSRSILDQF